MYKCYSLLLELKGYGEFANIQNHAIMGEQEDAARTVENLTKKLSCRSSRAMGNWSPNTKNKERESEKNGASHAR